MRLRTKLYILCYNHVTYVKEFMGIHLFLVPSITMGNQNISQSRQIKYSVVNCMILHIQLKIEVFIRKKMLLH